MGAASKANETESWLDRIMGLEVTTDEHCAASRNQGALTKKIRDRKMGRTEFQPKSFLF